MNASKNLINKLLFCSFLAASFALTSIASATYRPPAQPSSPKGPTGSNSSRTNGCTGNAQTTLTALAPLSHVGYTASFRPTFAWYVPDSTTREVEFSLYEYGANGKSKRIQRAKLQSTNGLMKFTLPAEAPALSIGQRYFWQVALLCNPNRPSEDLIVKAEFEPVAMPSNLKNVLTQTQEHQKRAELFALAGFWYDALGEIVEDPINKAYRLTLLDKLRELETEGAKSQQGKIKKNLEQQASQLQRIIAIEQQKI
ncbi:DUF928 domain-containing protein [Dulcicalothrix desertica]|nr:DUF928 domain-containing protein [Dulcicalothrix desertica]